MFYIMNDKYLKIIKVTAKLNFKQSGYQFFFTKNSNLSNFEDKTRSAKVDFYNPWGKHFVIGVIFMKLAVNLSILFNWSQFRCFEIKSSKM